MKKEIISNLKILKTTLNNSFVLIALIDNIKNNSNEENIIIYFTHLISQLQIQILDDKGVITEELKIIFDKTKNEIVDFHENTLKKKVKILESKTFKVNYDDVYKELKLFKNNVSIVYKLYSIFRPLTDNQIANFAVGIIRFIRDINFASFTLQDDRTTYLSEDFELYEKQYFYMYVNEYIYKQS